MALPAPYGKYLLIDKIAKGGMAEVFLAKQTGSKGFERLLAIKRILPQFTENAEFVSMFINEAKVAAALSHPNIVQIYDFGEVEESFYIGMEYVMGKDLRTVMERSQKSGKPLSIDQILLIISRVCSGLEHAHKKKDLQGNSLNLVHRDISPQNILISYDGDVKLVDFGIAKVALQEHETRTGILKGKLAYMSPEQAWGKQIDHRSDLFSLGIVLYECVTGKRLFKGDSEINTLERVREAKFDSPRRFNSNITSQVEAALAKALAKEVSDRYDSAGRMQNDLERALSKSLSEIQGELAQILRQLFVEEIEKDQTRMRKAALAVPEPTPAPGSVASPGSTSQPSAPSQPSLSPPRRELPQKKGGAMVLGASLVGALVLIGVLAFVFLKKGDDSESLIAKTPLTVPEAPPAPPAEPKAIERPGAERFEERKRTEPKEALPPPPVSKPAETASSAPAVPSNAPKRSPVVVTAEKKPLPPATAKKPPVAAKAPEAPPEKSAPPQKIISKEVSPPKQQPIQEASLPPVEKAPPPSPPAPVEKAPPPKPPIASDEELIRQVVKRQEAAFENKDVTLYLQDLIDTSPKQEKEIRKVFDQYETISVQFDISDLQIDGNRATLLMRQESRLKPKKSSKTQSAETKVSWGLIKAKDGWKINDTKVLDK